MRFSQWDGPWSSIPLGLYGGHTLSSAGCLVTSLADVLLDCFEVKTDPGRLNRWLCRNDGFTQGNLVVFGAVCELAPIQCSVVDCVRTPAPMDRVQAMLDAGGGVLAKVDFIPGGSIQQHWVRVTEVDGDDCLIHDPWLCRWDEEYSLLAKYARHDWDDAARAIFRLALYYPKAAMMFAPSLRGVAQEEVCVRP